MLSLSVRKIAAWGAALAALALAAAPAVRAADAASAAKPAGKTPKILMLTHYSGFKHSSLPVGEKVFMEMGKKSGVYEGTVVEGYKQDPKNPELSFLTRDYLKQFDGLFFFTQGDPPFTEEQHQAILDFVMKDGKAFVAVHCGGDTAHNWPAYVENLSGGLFVHHGSGGQPLTLKIEDPKHPATKMLGAEWTIADEFYQFDPATLSRDRVHVLMSVNTEKSDLKNQAGMTVGGDYPLAWCKKSGAGRSFYTALGHREDVWENPVYQEHLLGGIKWALGLEPGDDTPSNQVKK